MILNLGCGYNKEPGEVTFDIDSGCKPLVVGNAERLPFKSESFSNVVISHVLEHVGDLVAVMNEVWRVMKRGSKLVVSVPEYPHWTAVADPSHRRYFVHQTFEYFCYKGKLTGLKNIFHQLRLSREITPSSTGEKLPSLVWVAYKPL